MKVSEKWAEGYEPTFSDDEGNIVHTQKAGDVCNEAAKYYEYLYSHKEMGPSRNS